MRLIDANAISYDQLLNTGNKKHPLEWAVSQSRIDNVPTIDAEPVRHGRWIENDNGTYSCSECHSWIPNEQHHYARYCLHCGAKMEIDEKRD